MSLAYKGIILYTSLRSAIEHGGPTNDSMPVKKAEETITASEQ